MEFLEAIWRSAKQWHAIPIGPVSVSYRLARNKRVSSNLLRRLGESFLSRTNGKQSVRVEHPLDVARPPTVTTSPSIETALIVGVGPGLGFGLARVFARANMNVALASRDAGRLDPFVRQLRLSATKSTIRAYGCDASNEASVKSLMSYISSDMGVPNLVVYAVQGFDPGTALNTEVAAFEESWRANCLGAFIVAREAARRMVTEKRGTIILVGSTSSLIGRADYLNLAVGKFGLRALSQVMAREWSAMGIHVVHTVIDADIREDDRANGADQQASPDDIGSLIYSLHKQPKGTWTSEIDARPWNEDFWKHC